MDDPDAGCVLQWDGTQLIYGPGVDASHTTKDDLEDLWRSYYRATFNPARIKIKTMKREMPVRHWQTLPETDIIADMLAEAPSRVEAMIAHQEGRKTSAVDFMPEVWILRNCVRRRWHVRVASFIVHQRKRYSAKVQIWRSLCWSESNRVMTRDIGGRPFIGPSGEILMRPLQQAGIDRGDVYITNAVKHFRFCVARQPAPTCFSC